MWPFQKFKDKLDKNFPPAKSAPVEEKIEVEKEKEEEKKDGVVFGAGNKDGDARSHKVGFRHSLMSLVIAVVVVMLIGTFVSGLLKQKKPGRNEEMGSSKAAENFQSPAMALPKDYSGLNQMVNDRKTTTAAGGQNTETKTGVPTTPPIGANGTTLRGPAPTPSILTAAPAAPAAPTTSANVNNWMKSGISFSVAAAQQGGSSVQPAAAGGQNPASSNNGGSAGGGGGNSKIGVYQQSRPNTLLAGSIVPVTLITGINSDVAGDVVAQVRQDVYDSVTGETLLIPQGARLIGVYDGSTKNGQSRIGVAFTRIIFPDGNFVEIDKQKGTDSSGYPGLADKVDNHTGRLVGAGVMTSLLSAAAQIAAGNTNTSNNTTFGQLAVQGAASNLMNAGGELLKRDMQITPTITIRPGIQFTVFINKDLTLPAYGG